MPDLDAALDELRSLRERPPTSPAPVDEVATQARRRRHRRHARTAGAAAALLAIVVAVSVAAPDADRTAEVRTVDRPADVSPTTARPWELSITPSTGLTDGQVVTVSGPFHPSTVVGVAQCGAEAGDDSVGDPLPWCDINVQRSGGPGENELSVTVGRTIQTSHGLIDCAERPERCVIGIRTPSGTDVVAPISFRNDLGPVRPPEVALDRTSVADGETTTVRGTGFRAGVEVNVAQCVEAPGAQVPTADRDPARCDQARGKTVVPDEEGSFEVPFALHAEVLLDRWQRCEPCVVEVAGGGQPSALAQVTVALSGEPIRPTVHIVPDGPYEPGQRVRLEGSGFQKGSTPSIGWCSFAAGDPWQQSEGNPQDGTASCAYPDEGFGAVVDDTGSFTVDDFPLPAGQFVGLAPVDCTTPGSRCGLAWHPMEGSPPAFVTLFEMRG